MPMTNDTTRIQHPLRRRVLKKGNGLSKGKSCPAIVAGGVLDDDGEDPHHQRHLEKQRKSWKKRLLGDGTKRNNSNNNHNGEKPKVDGKQRSNTTTTKTKKLSGSKLGKALSVTKTKKSNVTSDDTTASPAPSSPKKLTVTAYKASALPRAPPRELEKRKSWRSDVLQSVEMHVTNNNNNTSEEEGETDLNGSDGTIETCSMAEFSTQSFCSPTSVIPSANNTSPASSSSLRKQPLRRTSSASGRAKRNNKQDTAKMTASPTTPTTLTRIKSVRRSPKPSSPVAKMDEIPVLDNTAAAPAEEEELSSFTGSLPLNNNSTTNNTSGAAASSMSTPTKKKKLTRRNSAGTLKKTKKKLQKEEHDSIAAEDASMTPVATPTSVKKSIRRISSARLSSKGSTTDLAEIPALDASSSFDSPTPSTPTGLTRKASARKIVFIPKNKKKEDSKDEDGDAASDVPAVPSSAISTSNTTLASTTTSLNTPVNNSVCTDNTRKISNLSSDMTEVVPAPVDDGTTSAPQQQPQQSVGSPAGSPATPGARKRTSSVRKIVYIPKSKENDTTSDAAAAAAIIPPAPTTPAPSQKAAAATALPNSPHYFSPRSVPFFSPTLSKNKKTPKKSSTPAPVAAPPASTSTTPEPKSKARPNVKRRSPSKSDLMKEVPVLDSAAKSSNEGTPTLMEKIKKNGKEAIDKQATSSTDNDADEKAKPTKEVTTPTTDKLSPPPPSPEKIPAVSKTAFQLRQEWQSQADKESASAPPAAKANAPASPASPSSSSKKLIRRKHSPQITQKETNGKVASFSGSCSRLSELRVRKRQLELQQHYRKPAVTDGETASTAPNNAEEMKDNIKTNEGGDDSLTMEAGYASMSVLEVFDGEGKGNEGTASESALDKLKEEDPAASTTAALAATTSVSNLESTTTPVEEEKTGAIKTSAVTESLEESMSRVDLEEEKKEEDSTASILSSLVDDGKAGASEGGSMQLSIVISGTTEDDELCWMKTASTASTPAYEMPLKIGNESATTLNLLQEEEGKVIRFSNIVEAKDIPTLGDDSALNLFYTSDELAEFRYEAFMESVGLNPDEYD